MEIIRNIQVPTGNIIVAAGDRGSLEFLSIGDYGKDINLKCDAMGLSREPDAVLSHPIMPLEKKWVITISTQYGCSMNCTFCDVPKVGRGRNATLNDMTNQIETAMLLHPEVTWTERLNIHFARMGEPTWNKQTLAVARWLKMEIDKTHRVHPVISTMMPRGNKFLTDYLGSWMNIKNHVYDGEAGLQLSINSTNEDERTIMFNGNALDLHGIWKIMSALPPPKGRKITLNFAVAGYEINPSVLLRFFDPQHYIIKLTPMHKTAMAVANGIETDGDYTTMHPYREHEAAFKRAGYDVLVFIASVDEDLGRITCGNAILSGSMPDIPYREETLTP